VAIVTANDPVFWTAGGNAQYQFGDDLSIPGLFRTLLPGATFQEALKADPGLKQGFGVAWPALDELGASIEAQTGSGPLSDEVIRSLVTSNTDQLFFAMREVAQLDVVRSLRAVVGQVAITIGFARNEMTGNVRNVYREPIQAVASALNFVNQTFESPYFQLAVNGLTLNPMVGWIIRIAVDLLQLAAKIADAVRREKAKKMNMALARRMHVPLISADQDLQNELNEIATQQVLRHVQMHRAWKNFFPPAFIRSWQDFRAIAARDPESGPTYEDEEGVTSKLSSAWYVLGRVGGGSGFIPGSSQLMRMAEFDVRFSGGQVFNTGRFMTTASQTCGYLWQLIQKGGPAMFSLPTLEAAYEWDNYVHGLLEYGERCVEKGFTTSETGSACSDKEWDLDAKKKKTIPVGVSHLDELRAFVRKQFWARGPNRDQYPYKAYEMANIGNPDNWYYQNTVYAHALRALRDRQKSVIGGYDAFLVSPAAELEVNGKVVTVDGQSPVFRAFLNDPELVEKWENTITEILNDETLWRHVNWRDVPEYRYKGQSVRQILKARQPQFQLASGPVDPPVVPGGPEDFPPPNPPPLVGGNEGLPSPRDPESPVRRAEGVAGWMIGGALVLGTAGVAVEAYDRFGRDLIGKVRS